MRKSIHLDFLPEDDIKNFIKENKSPDYILQNIQIEKNDIDLSPYLLKKYIQSTLSMVWSKKSWVEMDKDSKSLNNNQIDKNHDKAPEILPRKGASNEYNEILNQVSLLKNEILYIKSLMENLAGQICKQQNNSNITIDKIVKIYSSDRDKQSISINKKIKDEIIELAKKEYGITDNNSKALETALLVTLLNSYKRV